MPTYEYQCKKCGSTFDIFQSIMSPPLRKSFCEKCGASQPVKRLISTGGAVLFKGSGFYQTDYRSDKYKKAASAESGAKSGESKESKSTGDAASKPAAAETPAIKPAAKESKPKTKP